MWKTSQSISSTVYQTTASILLRSAQKQSIVFRSVCLNKKHDDVSVKHTIHHTNRKSQERVASRVWAPNVAEAFALWTFPQRCSSPFARVSLLENSVDRRNEPVTRQQFVYELFSYWRWTIVVFVYRAIQFICYSSYSSSNRKLRYGTLSM